MQTADVRLVAAFLYGVLAMGFAVAALFFAKFWRATRDRLFVYLAVAFGLFAVERAAALPTFDAEAALWPYVLRIAGFLLIILALVEKNRAPGEDS